MELLQISPIYSRNLDIIVFVKVIMGESEEVIIGLAVMEPIYLFPKPFLEDLDRLENS